MAAARRDDARIRQFFAAYTKPEKVRLEGGSSSAHPAAAAVHCTPQPAEEGRNQPTCSLYPAHCSQVARECQALTDACEFLVADRWGQ